jgi:hypothetical protein
MVFSVLELPTWKFPEATVPFVKGTLADQVFVVLLDYRGEDRRRQWRACELI